MLQIQEKRKSLLPYIPKEHEEHVHELENDTWVQFVETVEGNRKNYTTAHFESAKKARKVCHIIGPATIQNFKWILRSNQIKNCPVLPEHVIAEDI